jgi:hypothetical protein
MRKVRAELDLRVTCDVSFEVESEEQLEEFLDDLRAQGADVDGVTFINDSLQEVLDVHWYYDD